jgi:hypothetical protein
MRRRRGLEFILGSGPHIGELDALAARRFLHVVDDVLGKFKVRRGKQPWTALKNM